MSKERAQKTPERDKGTWPIVPKQRALIFQGGGALGAYEAGVYRVLHDWIYKSITAGKKNENFFDVIAGTSIGAINGAIVVSYVLKNKREAEKRRKQGDNEARNWPEYWYGSADILEDFWNSLPIKNNFLMDWYDSSFWPWEYFHNTTKSMKEGWNEVLDKAEESMLNFWKDNSSSNNPFVKEWFDFLRFYTEALDTPASTEAARRHWTTMTLASPNVAAAIPRHDLKFLDPRGFRFRGEQRQVPFYWRYLPNNYSLREACHGYILDSIKTNPKEQEPRLLFVTVDVKSGDTVSFDSYPKRDKSGNNTWFTEYEEYADNKYKHLIKYPNGIEWEQLSTTFSMPDLYRYTTLEDESSAHGKDEEKRTFWDGGMSSNTPLREMISKHKEFWKTKREAKEAEGIPALNIYIADVWPAKISEYPVPSDNDFVASRKGNLLLMDKTEYEESVTKMITDYKELVEKIIKSIEDQHTQDRIKEILDTEFTKSTIHTNNKKTYRQLLLDDKLNIDRVMRIERKDDTYAVGLAMADFSAHTIRQLMAFGKYDALDKLIHSLTYTVQNLDKLPKEMKDSLHGHLVQASNALGSNQNNYSYEGVMEHLYDFVDEVNTIESELGKDQYDLLNLLRP